MKKIAIYIVILGMALSYSCKKEENKLVNTIFKGQLVVNGTDEPIEISNEIPRPKVAIYSDIEDIDNDIVIGGANGTELIASVEVDKEGKFYMEVELYENDEYLYGALNIDKTVYEYGAIAISENGGWGSALGEEQKIIPGEVNIRNIVVNTTGWYYKRFINSNINFNNQDVFKVISGSTNSYVITDSSFLYNSYVFNGSTDSIIQGVLYKTWGGTYRFGFDCNDWSVNRHYVSGKLTRDGVTRDTIIYYSVLPFDTTIVEIRY
ncbi:MAG: hypothetical protein AUJ98_09265 [Bacteroidetes bacterium CG2_30_33_31]|nr:MAG: hypothetical protein AUJ98_09265 [Bacteroidetes bacterium CG2_30_33_31]